MVTTKVLLHLVTGTTIFADASRSYHSKINYRNTSSDQQHHGFYPPARNTYHENPQSSRGSLRKRPKGLALPEIEEKNYSYESTRTSTASSKSTATGSTPPQSASSDNNYNLGSKNKVWSPVKRAQELQRETAAAEVKVDIEEQPQWSGSNDYYAENKDWRNATWQNKQGKNGKREPRGSWYNATSRAQWMAKAKQNEVTAQEQEVGDHGVVEEAKTDEAVEQENVVVAAEPDVPIGPDPDAPPISLPKMLAERIKFLARKEAENGLSRSPEEQVVWSTADVSELQKTLPELMKPTTPAGGDKGQAQTSPTSSCSTTALLSQPPPWRARAGSKESSNRTTSGRAWGQSYSTKNDEDDENTDQNNCSFRTLVESEINRLHSDIDSWIDRRAATLAAEEQDVESRGCPTCYLPDLGPPPGLTPIVSNLPPGLMIPPPTSSCSPSSSSVSTQTPSSCTSKNSAGCMMKPLQQDKDDDNLIMKTATPKNCMTKVLSPVARDDDQKRKTTPNKKNMKIKGNTISRSSDDASASSSPVVVEHHLLDRSSTGWKPTLERNWTPTLQAPLYKDVLMQKKEQK